MTTATPAAPAGSHSDEHLSDMLDASSRPTESRQMFVERWVLRRRRGRIRTP
jgi:hypothetical protein